MRPERPRVHAIPPSTDGSGAPDRPRTSSRIQPWSRSMSVARCAGSGGWLTSPSASWRPPTGLSASSIAHAEAGARATAQSARSSLRPPWPVSAWRSSTSRTTRSADMVRTPSGTWLAGGSPPIWTPGTASTEWHLGPYRSDRRQPWYTFDRDRRIRDRTGRRDGTPEDHQVPQPGDSPADRALARRRELLAARGRRTGSDGSSPASSRRSTPGFRCSCPAACDELDDWSGRPVHADGCPCLCDLG